MPAAVASRRRSIDEQLRALSASRSSLESTGGDSAVGSLSGLLAGDAFDDGDLDETAGSMRMSSEEEAGSGPASPPAESSESESQEPPARGSTVCTRL